MIKTLSKNAIIGYPAGVITGITYGHHVWIEPLVCCSVDEGRGFD